MAIVRTTSLAEAITVGFATSSFVFNLLDVNPFDGVTRESVDISHQGTANVSAGEWSNVEKLFSTMVDGGTCSITGFVDTEMADTIGVPPLENTSEVVTITMPLATGAVTPATIIGTAGIVNVTMTGTYKQAMVYAITLDWSGVVNSTAAST